MALWLGIMRIAEDSGLVISISKALSLVMKPLFPQIPANHPAMGAIVMNMGANILGLGNAATPLGINAMKEMQKLNPNKDVATNSMVMFLAINTSSVTLIPATVIAIRASAGSLNPTEIIGPTIIVTTASTIAAIAAVKILERLPKYAIPFMLLAIPSYGLIKRVKVYESFTEGAKDGFDTAVRIIPYLVAMLVSIGVFRASGALDILVTFISPLTDLIGMPGEVLPMAFMRPLSGGGASGIMSELISTYGPESLIGRMVSVMMGSTETTFYVLAMLFIL